MTLSPEIQKFAEAMQTELDANVRKGNWREFRNDNGILSEIAWHQAKLLWAIRTGDKEGILEHAADCANYYMMIAHSKGLLDIISVPSSDCSPSE